MLADFRFHVNVATEANWMNNSVDVVWLGENDVRRALCGVDLREEMERALKAFSCGRAVQPVRTALPLPSADGVLASMPATLPDREAAGAKLVSFAPGNAKLGLPTHLAMVALFHPVTGALLAVMDGRYITETRTAAVSRVSIRALARRDIRRLGVLGSGVQARSHIAQILADRWAQRVSVWGPEVDQVKQLAKDLSTSETPIEIAQSAEAAVSGADVVLLATASSVPAIRSEWVRPGTHVVSIGACRPTQRELDPNLVARSHLIVDSRAAAIVESGDVVMGIAEGHFRADWIAGELGEVLLDLKTGRTTSEEITVFKALGLAVEDVAAAALVYDSALRLNLGTRLSL
jgi:ornithine cyclodeaminase